MFDSPWTIVIFLLVAAWLVQFAFSYFQMRNFYRRLTVLRRDGMLAVGKGGGQYRGRAYGVLVIDDEGKVIHAEKLAGWTVFAKLRPVPELVGLTIEEILGQSRPIYLSKKLHEAFTNAAYDLATMEDEEGEIEDEMDQLSPDRNNRLAKENGLQTDQSGANLNPA